MKHLKKKRKKNWAKVVVLIITMILLLVLSVVAFFISKLDKISYEGEVPKKPVVDQVDDPAIDDSDDSYEDLKIDIGDLTISETAPPIPESEIAQSDEVVNILLLGTDERSQHFNYVSRSDSMILVSINKDKNTVRLVSFERGIGVPILDGQYKGQYDLLTHTFRWGGAELVEKTIEHCFKINIDHYVRLNFNSVTEIVDAIGGIDLELTKAEANAINNDVHSGKKIVKAGLNHVDGETALGFARLRKIDSDWKRVERQRKVILAVVDKLKGSNLLTLNNLIDTVLPMVQTNMSKVDIAELALYAPSFLKSEFDQMTIPKKGTYGGMTIREGAHAFAVDYEINNDLLYRFLYEGATSEELLAE